MAARQAVADRIRSLTKSKLKSELDASFAEVNLAEANLLLLDAENGDKAALAALAAVLGYADQPDFELIEETGSLEPPPSGREPAHRRGLFRRPELAVLDLEMRAAERFHLAESDLVLPNVRALGAVGATPFGASSSLPGTGPSASTSRSPFSTAISSAPEPRRPTSRPRRPGSGSSTRATSSPGTCA